MSIEDGQQIARYVAHSGDDLLVVNAARVSFAKRSEWASPSSDAHRQRLAERDAKLIDYLARHEHWTPFAHPQITLHVRAPVFVRTQCFKHKVGFVENEISRRYVDDEPEFYVPTTWRERAAEKKQGSGDELRNVSRVKADETFGASLRVALNSYYDLLSLGVAPEQARMVLPQAMYTEWFWTGSLAAWARFCRLRMDAHAQEETRDVAVACAAIIEPLFPVSWKALTSC